ncbi:MAG TPA: hypothetical protein DCE41_00670 [Cytophagales bacterium]|nr:hypothetical protein [Cytophagales bacterium]HAA23593.1 hypothetical protein [Cytophagales bacterium]HAP60731.1 hypothetical protein [Cytophagales bacterium]
MLEMAPRKTPKWLHDLQQRSWEPEILLSGIVLYGMFRVPDMLDEFLAYFKLNIYGNSQDIDNLISLSKFGIYWLITGLVLHLICRGIWIGMVGLSYTFPRGIVSENLKYQEKFREKTEKTADFERVITRLDKISSALFSLSFLLFMSLLGGYMYVLLLVILPISTLFFVTNFDISAEQLKILTAWVYLCLTVGIIGLIDFISLGYFRRFKYVARVLWPIHRVVSWITLARFYRPIYYGFASNISRWKFFLLLLVFSVGSVFGALSTATASRTGDLYSRITYWVESQGSAVSPQYYTDQMQGQPSLRAHIPSDIIEGDVLRLFVVANVLYKTYLDEHLSQDSLQLAHPEATSVELLQLTIKEFITVTLDGEVQPIDNWYFHYHQTAGQRGYLAYLDISQLPRGMHHVNVYLGTYAPDNEAVVEIPFFRDAHPIDEEVTE